MLGASCVPAPRKFSDEEELYTAALRALMRRAYSVFEMRTYLERRADEPDAGSPRGRAPQAGKADRRRALRAGVRAPARQRREDRAAIASRGSCARAACPIATSNAAIAQIFAETDEALLVRKLIERKLRTARGPLDDRAQDGARSTACCCAPDSTPN